MITGPVGLSAPEPLSSYNKVIGLSAAKKPLVYYYRELQKSKRSLILLLPMVQIHLLVRQVQSGIDLEDFQWLLCLIYHEQKQETTNII